MNAAQEVAEVIEREYEAKKGSPFFTWWGVCYFWDSERRDFSDEPVSSGYEGLVRAVFEELKRKKETLPKPKLYVPRARDEVAHYSLWAMRNLDKTAAQFVEWAEAPEVGSIVNDQRYAQEGVRAYVQEEKLPKGVDLFDFLAFYREGKKWMGEGEPQGQYRFLLERLLVRFEESPDVFESVASLVGGLAEPLRDRHRQAELEKRPRMDPDALAAYRSFVGEVDAEWGEGLPKLAPRRVFGKRRVKIGCGSNGYFQDLEEWAERLRGRGKVYLDPNQWLKEQLINTLLLSQLEAYRRDPLATVAGVKRKQVKAMNPAEAQAWGVVASRLEALSLFDGSEHIHHSMRVMKKGDIHGK